MGDRNFNYLSDMNSAQPTKGLFVGDLSSSTTERDLQALFGRFGQVVAVEVKRGRHGDSLLHGFVEFDSASSAFTAIQALNGIKFKSRKMRVNWTNTKFTPTLEAESWIQVQVNFSSKNVGFFIFLFLFGRIFVTFYIIYRDVLLADH
jgi:RNA recognition motif-containing protein